MCSVAGWGEDDGVDVEVGGVCDFLEEGLDTKEGGRGALCWLR